MNKRLLCSHGLTHLEASIWAVGWADSGRPRGTSLHDSLHPLQDSCHSQNMPKPLLPPDNEAVVTQGRVQPPPVGDADALTAVALLGQCASGWGFLLHFI